MDTELAIYDVVFAVQMVAGGIAGCCLGLRTSRRVAIWTGLGAVTLITANSLFHRRPEWDFLARFPAYIYFSNWQAWLVPLLCGLSISQGRMLRDRVEAGALAAVAILAVILVDPLFLHSPLCLGDPLTDERGVVIQSSPSSCGAAAAASLLASLGVSGSEREMALLALARDRTGVTPLGLYRAVKRKLQHTAWTCNIRRATSAGLVASLPRLEMSEVYGKEHISEIPGDTRFLIYCRLMRDGPHELRQSWTVGVLHPVVLLGKDNENNVLVADPQFGVERWPIAHFEALFDGLTLVAEKRAKE